jgi:hypothetical protein
MARKADPLRDLAADKAVDGGGWLARFVMNARAPMAERMTTVPPGEEFTPEQVQEEAVKHGVDRTAAQITGSPLLLRMQAAAEKWAKGTDPQSHSHRLPPWAALPGVPWACAVFTLSPAVTRWLTATTDRPASPALTLSALGLIIRTFGLVLAAYVAGIWLAISAIHWIWNHSPF